MMNQEELPSTQGSSQEDLQSLEGQDLEKITGGTVDPTPLLKGVEQVKEVSHHNNGAYFPPAPAGQLRADGWNVPGSIPNNAIVPHPAFTPHPPAK